MGDASGVGSLKQREFSIKGAQSQNQQLDFSGDTSESMGMMRYTGVDALQSIEA